MHNWGLGIWPAPLTSSYEAPHLHFFWLGWRCLLGWPPSIPPSIHLPGSQAVHTYVESPWPSRPTCFWFNMCISVRRLLAITSDVQENKLTTIFFSGVDRNPLFGALHSFWVLNSPIMATFELTRWCHWVQSWEEMCPISSSELAPVSTVALVSDKSNWLIKE